MLPLYLQPVINDPSSYVIVALMLLFAFLWFLIPADRHRTERLFLLCVALGPCSRCVGAVLQWLIYQCPLKYDLYIYRIDAWFGEPSFRLGQWLMGKPVPILLIVFTYGFVTAAILGTVVLYAYLRSETEAHQIAVTFIVNLVAAVGFYLIFPVCGPMFAFPDFPRMPPAGILPHPMAISAPPNGLPSVHMSTALLVCWFLRHWWWGRIAGVAFVFFTVLATLGSGQHYLFDLFCSVPYAIGVVWVTHMRERRVPFRRMRLFAVVLQHEHIGALHQGKLLPETVVKTAASRTALSDGHMREPRSQ